MIPDPSEFRKFFVDPGSFWNGVQTIMREYYLQIVEPVLQEFKDEPEFDIVIKPFEFQRHLGKVEFPFVNQVNSTRDDERLALWYDDNDKVFCLPKRPFLNYLTVYHPCEPILCDPILFRAYLRTHFRELIMFYKQENPA